MNIQHLPLSEIHPYPGNPRDISQAVPLVANSIRQFGFKNPIIVDREHVIISGHARYAAAQELELETVPCIVSDMSEEQARAFRIADNKSSEIATWDYAKLNEELAKAKDMDVDIDLETEFGFVTNDEHNPDDIYGDKKEPKEKDPEYVTCPHCGHLNPKP